MPCGFATEKNYEMLFFWKSNKCSAWKIHVRFVKRHFSFYKKYTPFLPIIYSETNSVLYLEQKSKSINQNYNTADCGDAQYANL